jgi:hypothetical protein
VRNAIIGNGALIQAGSAIVAVTGATTAAVASSTRTSPSTYGDNMTFTAAVSIATGARLPQGMVQFVFDGANLRGAGRLDDRHHRVHRQRQRLRPDRHRSGQAAQGRGLVKRICWRTNRLAGT